MKKILIVDDEEEIRELYRLYLESQIDFNIEILEASNGEEGICALQKHDDISLIVSDYHMPKATGGQLFLFNQDHKKIPFAIATAAFLDRTDDLKDFTKSCPPNIHLPKPTNFDQLLEWIGFTLKGNISRDREYYPIRIPFFLRSSKKLDVFLKRGESYIQIFKKEDGITVEQLKRYQEKGQRFVYLRKDDFLSFFDSFQEKLFKIVHDAKTPKESFNALGLTLNFVSNGYKELGISKKQIELVNDSVSRCVQNLTKNDESFSSLLTPLLKDQGYPLSHTMSSIHISYMISKELKYSSEMTLEKLTFAALLHDLPLIEEDLCDVMDLKSKKYEELDRKKQALVRKHVEDCIEIIGGNPDLPGEVIHIVHEHHERPDGSGFPRGLESSRISPLGCIFILALEVADFIYYNKVTETSLAQLMGRLQKYNSGNFKGPLKALMKVLERY